ncbi:MAG TPA: response regulator, partial [Candidatus Omnitrophota bacterium]|nr:response regulator [Candidatus Omnitrophota bacterium]
GKDTLQTLLKLDPQVKAVAFSGYSNDPVMARYQEYGFKGVLVKPFKYDELCALLKSLIKK